MPFLAQRPEGLLDVVRCRGSRHIQDRVGVTRPGRSSITRRSCPVRRTCVPLRPQTGRNRSQIEMSCAHCMQWPNAAPAKDASLDRQAACGLLASGQKRNLTKARLSRGVLCRILWRSRSRGCYKPGWSPRPITRCHDPAALNHERAQIWLRSTCQEPTLANTWYRRTHLIELARMPLVRRHSVSASAFYTCGSQSGELMMSCV